MLNGEALEEVDQFKYLGSVIAVKNYLNTIGKDLILYHRHGIFM